MRAHRLRVFLRHPFIQKRTAAGHDRAVAAECHHGVRAVVPLRLLPRLLLLLRRRLPPGGPRLHERVAGHPVQTVRARWLVLLVHSWDLRRDVEQPPPDDVLAQRLAPPLVQAVRRLLLAWLLLGAVERVARLRPLPLPLRGLLLRVHVAPRDCDGRPVGRPLLRRVARWLALRAHLLPVVLAAHLVQPPLEAHLSRAVRFVVPALQVPFRAVVLADAPVHELW